MADKELGALSPIETLLAAALFHTVQQGNSRKVTAQQIADFVNGNYPAFIQTLLSAQDADDVYAAIGAAPDANKLGGQLPSFFATAQDVATAFDQLTKADVGLGNVDNTSDTNKPVSTAQQNALDTKIAGPASPVGSGDIVAFAETTGKAGRKATPAEVKIAAGVGTGPLNGLRNKIINGDFLRWTRGTSQTTTGYGSADRWNNVSAGSTKTTALGAFALGVMPFEDKYYMRTTVTSVAGAGNSVRAIHHLEGVEQLAGKQVTLSYWARTTGADKFMSTELTQIFGNTGSPSAAVTAIGVRKVLLSSTAGISGFQKYAHTFVMPPIVGKTETTNSNVGVQFWFDAGTSFNDRTDNLGQQSGVFDIAHVSLVEGDATQEDDPFGWLPLQQKIALCDRYCTRLTTGFQGGQPGYFLDYYRFPVPMRTTPSVNVVNAGSAVNATLIDPANALSNLGGGFQINVTAAQGYLVGWTANFDAEIS